MQTRECALQFAPPGAVQLRGVLGEALAANHRGRLAKFIVDETSPAIAIGINAMNPAIGPATPISNTAVRDGIGDFIRMNAPNVPAGPIIGGVGIKNGSVASTP